MTNQIINAITNANAQEGIKFDAIPAEIQKLIDTANQEIFNAECYRLATLAKEEFFTAFFAVELEKNLKEKETANAVKFAVSVTIHTIAINDAGLLEYGTAKKAITFSDVFKARCKYHANGHTDKDAKRDKANAIAHFFGDYGVGFCELLTHQAYQFMNIDTTMMATNAHYLKTWNSVATRCAEKKEGNPFEKSNNTGYGQQIQMAYNYFLGDSACKVNSYHAKGFFQIIVNRGRNGRLTINDEYAVLNALAVIYRYAFNGYKLPTLDKTNIYKQPQTK